MKSIFFLFFVFLAVFTTQVHTDIRMTGPVVTLTAPPDPGKADVVDVYEVVNNRLEITETRKASYDLLVKAETEAYGNGWVGVRVEGSLDTGRQLNPGVSVERVSRLGFFPEMETTTAYARGNFITDSTGTRTLTGKGIAALSAGGGTLSFSAGGWGFRAGEGRFTLDGTVITKTTTFTINKGREVPAVIGDSGGGSGSSGCANNPNYD